MARKIDVKRILEEKLKGTSHNCIASDWGISKHSVKDVVARATELGILPDGPILDKTDEELYSLFFPDKRDSADTHAPVDFDYVHRELNRVGVTLKLLWTEYRNRCQAEETIAMSYSKFCRGYEKYSARHGFANHIYHKAGDRVEVDWSGPTMHYVDPQTGRQVTVHLFVSDLVSSRLAFVEPTLSMDEQNWLQCHVDMFKYYGGVPRLIVCDNLLTGVQHHPHEGEIVLTREYEQLAEYYGTAILPARVRKPRDKSSTENTVYNVALRIIAKLRNIEFRSFLELKAAVAEKLEELNDEPFEKRQGSRRSDFETNERGELKPLPTLPYEVGTWYWGRKVQPNCHVAYKKNWYSVPSSYMGQSVDLRITTSEVQVFSKGNLIKRHLILPSSIESGYRTDEKDMPHGAGYVEWDSERIMRWARSIGPSTATVIERILGSRAIVEQSFNSALAVLRMTKRYSKEAIEKASGEALSRTNSPRYRHIKAILASSREGSEVKNSPAEAKGILKGAEYFASLGGGDNA